MILVSSGGGGGFGFTELEINNAPQPPVRRKNMYNAVWPWFGPGTLIF